MKLQHLTIIFIIIMLPIFLVLSTYIGTQIDTLYLQTAYNTKLNDATYDAMQAFQLNTKNNDYSTVADSLKRDVGASINTFYTSLAGNMGVSGYSREELQPYIPAVLYTMYDGYYIYSPTKTEAANEDAESLLKQYIYYSARYVNSHTDVVINYSLDSYISVYGIVDGKYIARSGYLTELGENGIKEIIVQKLDGTGNQTIEWDNVKVKVDNATYGTGTGTITIKDGAIWTDANCTEQLAVVQIKYKDKIIKPEAEVVVRGDNNEFIKKDESKEALYYYLEALEFSKYISSLSLNLEINENDTKVYINDQLVYEKDGTDNKISAPTNLFDITNNIDPEDLQSNFVNHKREIIRLSIENNLQNAFNNYKGTVGTDYNYQLPKFKEEEWEKIYKNVSVVTFMQGIQVGSKMYNNYSIVTSTGNEEYVDPEELYFIDNDDDTYHRITDTVSSFNTTTGYRSAMFEKRNTVNTTTSPLSDVFRENDSPDGKPENVDALFALLGKTYTADYNTIVNAKAKSVYSNDGKLAGNVDDSKKEAYYTTLGRERYEILKLRATSILNSSKTIKTKVSASAKSIGVAEGGTATGEISATLKPTNMFPTNPVGTYKIEGGTQVIDGPASFTNGTVTIPVEGLNQNTTYKVTVSATDNYGRTVTDVATFTTGKNQEKVIVTGGTWSNGYENITITRQNTTDNVITGIQEIGIGITDKINFNIGEFTDSINKEYHIKSYLENNDNIYGEYTSYDHEGPSVTITDKALQSSSIGFKVNVKDYKSGLVAGTSNVEVILFIKDENITQAIDSRTIVTGNLYNNELNAEVLFDGIQNNEEYYIIIKVKDRVGNETIYDSREYGIEINTYPNPDDDIPDAVVEVIPDNPNTPDDDDDIPNDKNANIIARYTPTYYVDGETEKVRVTLETYNLDDGYSIKYKFINQDTWTNYTTVFEVSENTAILVKLVKDNKEGDIAVFNINNIDKAAPELEWEGNPVVGTNEAVTIKVKAKDTGAWNSGLKELKIDITKTDNSRLNTIYVPLAAYNAEDNSGDKTEVIYDITGIDNTYKTIVITATDCVGRVTTERVNINGENIDIETNPLLEVINVSNSNQIHKNFANKEAYIEIQLKVTDERNNINLETLKPEDFIVKVGEQTLNVGNAREQGTEGTYLQTSISKTEDSQIDNLYVIDIFGITGDGELSIELKEGVIKDRAGNVNQAITLLPNNLSNNKNGNISNIIMDNTTPVVGLIANPYDVSENAINEGIKGKKSIISANVTERSSGIYEYTYKIEDKYNLKQTIEYPERERETNLTVQEQTSDAPEITTIDNYELTTTFGIYNVTFIVKDRAGNKTETKVNVYDYTISTKEELHLLQQYAQNNETFLGKTITLLNNIDLSNDTWEPISYFAGTFEGNEKEISNISNMLFTSNAGTIQNLSVNGKIETSKDNVGMISAINSGTIKNCHIQGNIKGNWYVGGIVGNNRGLVENCSSNAESISARAVVGGIVGINETNSIVRKCYNLSTIKSSQDDLGGIVGWNAYGKIYESYNSGELQGTNCYHIGGIVGYNAHNANTNSKLVATIENCYNTGKIVSNVGMLIGGITSRNANYGLIKNCYNIGKIEASGGMHDIVPQSAIVSNSKVENCYYNSDIGNKGTTEITNNFEVYAKTTQEMQEGIFVILLGIENWKEDTVPLNNNYPILKWQEGVETVILQKQNVTINTITVKATATDSEYTFYKYRILTEDGTEVAFVEGGTNTEYTFTGLTPDTNYIIEAYAYKNASYDENNKLSPKNVLRIRTLKKIDMQFIEIKNDNTINPNYANQNNTIQVILNENDEEEIKIYQDKIKVMINGNVLDKSLEENANYTVNITNENGKITLTLTGIGTEGILSLILEQGVLYTETGRESEEMLLDANTVNIEIDNTKPEIGIEDISQDVTMSNVQTGTTAEDKISEIKENFVEDKTYYIVNQVTNPENEITLGQFVTNINNGGQTYKNKKIILQIDITYTGTINNFEGWFDGNGHKINVDLREAYLFNSFSGIVTNLQLYCRSSNADYQGTDAFGLNGFAYYNYGLIQNVKIIEGSIMHYSNRGDLEWGAMAHENHGIIAECSNYATMDMRSFWANGKLRWL